MKRALPVLLIAVGSMAHAQYFKAHGVSISAGATTSFDKDLTSHATTGTYTIPTPAGGFINTTVSGQQQFTTESVGFLTSFQIHPKPWAGVEFNYGFNHYSERYAFDYTAATTAQTANVKTDLHEFTGAYQFHPKHIPFQPFVNVGGGALDFNPRGGTPVSNQFRGAGLLEAGFDLPTYKGHVGFRIEGRSLYYRAPNFYNSAVSTQSWRVSIQPSISTYYRF